MEFEGINFFMTIFLKKKIAVLTLIVALFAGGGIVATPHYAQAQTTPTVTPTVTPDPNASTSAGSSKNVVTSIVGWIVVALVWTLGQIMVVLMYLLLWVASYNDFINSPAVTNGWVILRDLCNMFFVLILLVIAFATVLNRENYAMKKLLPKFIIAAILINFSRLICGIIIDFAQVVMLTFVNGFRDIGGGNLANMLGISGYLSMSADSTQEVNTLTIVGTYILALLYSIIATVVVATMLFVLVVRMVMIWIYVVLSPLPYLLSVLPATEKYASKWWDEFSKNVVAGPILAFFIWLSFASVQPDSTGASLINGATEPNAGTNEEQKLKGFETSNAGAPEAGISKSGSADNMLKFIISIGLLMGGLMITKELGGAVGSMAGAGFDKIKGAAKGVRNLATRPVTDRWQAFQGQREAARKEKIQGFGERMYGRYATAKSAVKAAPKAAARATFETAKQYVPQALKDKTNAVLEKAKFVKDTLTFKDFREARSERRAIDNRRRAAYQNPEGVYKDANGHAFDELEERAGKQIYFRYKEDENGQRVQQRDNNGDLMQQQVARRDAEGNVIPGEFDYEPIYEKEYAKETWGGVDHYVQKMEDREYKVSGSWTNSMKDAWAYTNKHKEQEITKEQQKMSDAGLTSEQALQVLQAPGSTDRQRMASALTLAIKEGFKSHDQIKAAEQVLGKENNNLLSKKFNDDVDKKQAYLHYDASTELGRNRLTKRWEDGKVDIQQAAAYKNADFNGTMKDAMSKEEYSRYIMRVSGTSNKHDEALQVGLAAHADTLTQPVLDPETEEVDKARPNLVKVTHRLDDSSRGANMRPEDIKLSVEATMDTMSLSDLTKSDYRSLQINDSQPTLVSSLQSDENKKMYNDTVKKTVQAYTEGQIRNMQTMKDANRKTVRELVRIWEEGNGPLQRKGGAQNQNLSTNTEDDEDDNNTNTTPS